MNEEHIIPWVETVGDLKEFIKDVPDDYAVMIEANIPIIDKMALIDNEKMDLAYSMSMGYDPKEKIFFVLGNY